MKKNKILLLLLTTTISQALNIKREPVNFKGFNLFYVDGRFNANDIYKIKRRVSGYDNVVLVFNSRGGNMNEGIKIGRYMLENGISSAVKENGVCGSACAFAFLGGKEKILGKNSRLGFHFFTYNGRTPSVEQIRKDTLKLLRYFRLTKTPEDLIEKILDTSHRYIYWVDRFHTNGLNIKKGLSLNINNKVNKTRVVKRQYNTKLSQYIKNINNRSILSLKNGNHIHSYLKKVRILNEYRSNGYINAYLEYIFKNGAKVRVKNRYTEDLYKIDTIAIKNKRKGFIEQNKIYLP